MNLTILKKINITSSLFILSLFLVLFGLAFLLSVSFGFAGNSFYMFIKQIVVVVLALLAGGILYFIDITKMQKLSFYFFLFTIILLILVAVLGKEQHGAKRWLDFGFFSFQPSELVKLSSVLYLSKILSKKEDERNDTKNIGAFFFIIILVGIFIIYLQNNFSTGFLIALNLFILLFLAGIKKRYLLSIGVILLFASSVVIFPKDYRLERIFSYISRDVSLDSNHQVRKSLEAISRGNFFGVGIGNSVYKKGGLPESTSDFIFAIIGEETGFFGMFLVLSLFIIFFIISIELASRVKDDKFKFFVSVGLASSIVMQSFFHIAVSINLIPTTGVNLPFFSSGGTSIFVSICMVAILLNISKYSEVRKID